MLQLKGIYKTFNAGTVNEKRAIDNLNLTLEDGDFVTIIGGNGAGKSTTLNLIAGVYPVDAGMIHLNGYDLTNLPEHKRARFLGRVFQDPMMGTAATMGIEENLALAYRRGQKRGLGSGITNEERELYREKLATLGLGLENRMTSKVGLLSGGQRQALTLLMATLRKPDLLLLDEPINGLDPQGIAEIRDMIFKLRDEQNMTIIISSHILEELSKIATHYGIIHNGTLVQEITKEELMQRCGERMEIFLDDPKQALPVLDQMGFKNYQVTDKNTIHIYERLDESAAVNMELAKAGVSVRGIGITSEELENYFLNLTGGACNA